MGVKHSAIVFVTITVIGVTLGGVAGVLLPFDDTTDVDDAVAEHSQVNTEQPTNTPSNSVKLNQSVFDEGCSVVGVMNESGESNTTIICGTPSVRNSTTQTRESN